MARPRPKPKTITVQLEEPDREKLERLAAAADRKPSSYLRWLLRQQEDDAARVA